MYLHLGKNTAVDTDDIIAILDMDNLTIAKNSREFLRRAQDNGSVITVAEDVPKSVVIVRQDHVNKVYITNISSRALAGRAERINDYSAYALPDFKL